MASTTQPSMLMYGPAIVGLATHICYFRHGEHDLSSMVYLRALFLAHLAGVLVLFGVSKRSPVDALGEMATAMASFFVCFMTSMVIYRLFFHRLRNFRGPRTWAIAKLSQSYTNRDMKSYMHLVALHKEYGDFVRTGPRELSVIHPETARVTLGSGSRCTKTAWYDMAMPLRSLHQCRDKSTHDSRRRIWDRGFSSKALREYEPKVMWYAQQLMLRLKELSGHPINASRWMHYYSFDVMGELAFGESFHMIESGKTHFAIELLTENMRPMGIMTPVPWVFNIVKRIPGLSADHNRFVAWCNQQVDKRSQVADQRDIMSWLLEAEPMSSDSQENHLWLTGDARLIVVAGSDTVAAALTFALYELLKNPRYIEDLRTEVQPLLRDTEINMAALQKAKLLNAVINEALRLHPPIPAGVLRETPPEGIRVGETFVPGECIVNVPFYVLQRSAKAYAEPDAFIPERWTTHSHMVYSKDAYAPFSLGTFGCIGKSLALMEIRVILALLVTDFDLSFAAGEDGTNLIQNSEDHFTMGLASLNIRLQPIA